MLFFFHLIKTKKKKKFNNSVQHHFDEKFYIHLLANTKLAMKGVCDFPQNKKKRSLFYAAYFSFTCFGDITYPINICVSIDSNRFFFVNAWFKKNY
jgi:hypothetical protein